MLRGFICLLLICSMCTTTGCSKDYSNRSDTVKQIQTKFCLNYEEKRVYDLLKEDLSDDCLQNLDALSIVRIYIQTQFDNRYDIEKVLFLDNSDSFVENKTESQSQQIAKEVWFGIQQGEFSQTKETTNFIYEAKGGERNISIVKDENGIWKIDKISYIENKNSCIKTRVFLYII
ncbi:hypothetical protein [Romboutsia lituseburensis]|uniref:hypothetical protein n=1 Tax=Romboutsia lituseburensis TaxID=1537 RepID=UPI00215A8967|nr:hypothetical protein [Romboutsia lituseburensis]MCR8744030.1 hypothetical protein [Romboutsia lituseburensis]